MTFTELIQDSFKEWMPRDNIILDGGTGTGKTYFCINTLGSYAKEQNKKILFLCNRKRLEEVTKQHWIDAHNHFNGVIKIITYQKLQTLLTRCEPLSNYDYVIADECHYLMTDSYNNYTDYAYRYLKELTNSVVIYMSATATSLFNMLCNKGFVKEKNYYYIKRDYHFVNELHFYRKNQLTEFIDSILEQESESKILVFCNSAKRLIEMREIYGGKAKYTCSSSTTNIALKAFCDENVIENDKFEGKLLFTTSVLDNGIDLKDTALKYIFSEITDIDILIQSIGRKRPINDNDKCSIYIRDYYDRRELLPKIKRNKTELDPAIQFYRNKEEFKDMYKNDDRELFDKSIRYNPIFIFDNGKIGINEMKLIKHLDDSIFNEEIMSTSYKQAVMARLGEELSSKYVDDDSIKKHNKYPYFLEPYEEINLYKEEQQEIIKQFKRHGIIKRCNGVGTFNGVIEDDYPNYPKRFVNGYVDKRRKDDTGNRNPHRGHRYWRLENSG